LAVGIGAAGLSAYDAASLRGPSAIAPGDAALQQEARTLADSTPEAAARLEARLATARLRLPPEGTFDAWIQGTCRNWTVEMRRDESGPGPGTRHYALAYNHPTLASWPDILETTRVLGAVPGLSLDTLVMAAGPEGAEAFQEVRITLTARLRR
jgi:hypothetical protein